MVQKKRPTTKPGKQKAVARMPVRSWWEKATAHPITPIVLGAWLAMDAAGNIPVKSYALLFLWLWLCVDLFITVEDRRRPWKNLKSWIWLIGRISASAIFMLGLVWWLLHARLEEQQKDVSSGLSLRHRYQAGIRFRT